MQRSMAAFSMGCFWSPEALFGAQEGVIQTETGYAGGTLKGPTYSNMGDHSETVLVFYDGSVLPYEKLLDLFEKHHNPANTNDYKGRQYQSILYWSKPEQREAIRLWVERRDTEGLPERASEIRELTKVYPAEERHQKYYLKRYPDALTKLLELYGSIHAVQSSTLAARLNGLAKGFTNRSRLLEEMAGWDWEAPERLREQVEAVKRIRW
ncbi:peptide-methionine (S)-S-oxide reductase [Paenibacillus pasadenensis]|uniref:peptide-methionine (S)-S-oxide reductase MsrA n=1 Tax=Paenibacillus pasadenensis TaxID=217090 RepID=UPI00203DCC6F|nr:peptide-methionine (S)-S-oxide reductase [Paenibacillus pasadenensis]MCM3749408.1 peptide-methionine (S)-S-oxide reductase [Paenibacillus pasadenensis]